MHVLTNNICSQRLTLVQHDPPNPIIVTEDEKGTPMRTKETRAVCTMLYELPTGARRKLEMADTPQRRTPKRKLGKSLLAQTPNMTESSCQTSPLLNALDLAGAKGVPCVFCENFKCGTKMELYAHQLGTRGFEQCAFMVRQCYG